MEISLLVPDVDAPPGLSVRPDVLLVSVSARIEDVTPSQAVALLRSAALKMASRLAEVHPGSDTVARKLDLGRHSVDKAPKSVLADAQFDGVLRVPLDASADFWARAELVAKVTEVLRSLAVDWAKAKPAIRFGFRQPVARVRDVTAHRAALNTCFSDQLRALAKGESMGIANWEVPDEVVQQAVSLDEVRLLLVHGRKTSSS